MKQEKANFEKLDDTKHMLELFAAEPYNEKLSYTETAFQEQEASVKLVEFNVTSRPDWLNGGKKSEADNTMILKRSAVSFLCEFTLKDNYGTYDLKAVFTWVVVNLDTEPVEQRWIDLDGTLEEFGSDGLLKERIYLDVD